MMPVPPWMRVSNRLISGRNRQRLGGYDTFWLQIGDRRPTNWGADEPDMGWRLGIELAQITSHGGLQEAN
jgi:hypothetical protein